MFTKGISFEMIRAMHTKIKQFCISWLEFIDHLEKIGLTDGFLGVVEESLLCSKEVAKQAIARSANGSITQCGSINQLQQEVLPKFTFQYTG